MEQSRIHSKQYKLPPNVDETMLLGFACKDSGRLYRSKPVRMNAMREEEIFDNAMLGFVEYILEKELAHLRYRCNANTMLGS